MAKKAQNYDSKYQKNITQINADYGRVAPQATDLEEIVLGALMLEKGAIIDVADILTPESFYKDEHQKIFRSILHLSEEYKPVDILTITEELRKNGELESVGGAFYITQLTSRVASSAHVVFHARIIAQKYIQRELIRVSSDIQNRAFDLGADVDDLLDYSEREIYNIAFNNIKKETSSIKTVIDEAIKEMEERGAREDGLSGVPSGFTQLDALTSGWQRSDLIIIAARPSMGKTAFALTLARNMAVMHKQACAVFSLEMSSIQLVNRLIVGETGLASEKIKSGKLSTNEWQHLETKIKDLAEAPIFIDDTPAISLFELRAKCRRLKIQNDIKLVVLDYLQLMTASSSGNMPREQEVSMISRGLKALAKELNIPIIALSQLNRSVEMRHGDKRPQLSDLRESGAIEQDADIVIFIHRPERYGLTEDETGYDTKGMAEIILAKHRNGAVGDVKLRFISEKALFVDIDGDVPSFSDDEMMPADSGYDFQPAMPSRMNNSSTGMNPFGGERQPMF